MCVCVLASLSPTSGRSSCSLPGARETKWRARRQFPKVWGAAPCHLSVVTRSHPEGTRGAGSDHRGLLWSATSGGSKTGSRPEADDPPSQRVEMTWGVQKTMEPDPSKINVKTHLWNEILAISTTHTCIRTRTHTHTYPLHWRDPLTSLAPQ